MHLRTGVLPVLYSFGILESRILGIYNENNDWVKIQGRTAFLEPVNLDFYSRIP